MEADTKYRTAYLDDYWLSRFKSPCWKCKFIINGTTDFNCQKHKDNIPCEFWNKEEKCPDRIEK